jgi:hypothetical protein
MSIIEGTRFLERQQFFNGQRLFASDLQGLEAFHREMRWLHNQSLHQPGVGSGYAVAGATGASEVTIAPGYALDALGREIILVETFTEPIPPVADDGFGGSVYYDLTVSYPDDSSLEESETREGICLPRGVVRLEERPDFCWVRLGPPPEFQPVDDKLKADLQGGLRIRLARAEVLDCTLKRALSTTQRRNARPPEQPYVTCGQESLENAIIEPVEGDALRLRLTVDTSSAGFRTRPCYFASFVGPRLFNSADFPNTDSTGTFLFDGLTSLSISAEQSLTRFDIEMIGFAFPLTGSTPAIEDLPAVLKSAWQVDWIGVEG